MRYRVQLQPDEDGGWVVECPALGGCVSHGDTREEALANIAEAIAGVLASMRAHGDDIPPPLDEVEEEVVEIELPEAA